MNTIDYVYRFDPRNPSTKPPPTDAEGARKSLEDGNRTFARWMRHCQTSTLTQGEVPPFVLQCNTVEVGMERKPNGAPKQAPFAVVIGCSDARVPTEMIFGQGFNDLFVIRVAGNVLGDVCLGSVDFAIDALRGSVKVLVVLGHSGCGAVTGAVDAYLNPQKFWSGDIPPALRSILQMMFVSVRGAANCLKEVWGPDARQPPEYYREALIETAVALNAAHAAFALRQQVELTGHSKAEVVYGVYNLHNHQVSMPNDPYRPLSDQNVNLALAPSSPRDIHALGIKMAKVLQSRTEGRSSLTPGGGQSEISATSPLNVEVPRHTPPDAV